MKPAWVRAVRDECADLDIAFFMKQIGSNHYRWPTNIRGKGDDMDDWPEDLRVRQFPCGLINRKQRSTGRYFVKSSNDASPSVDTGGGFCAERVHCLISWYDVLPRRSPRRDPLVRWLLCYLRPPCLRTFVERFDGAPCRRPADRLPPTVNFASRRRFSSASSAAADLKGAGLAPAGFE
jgi:hypothetical protein